MTYTADILDSLVPITQFNRGQASRIFDRLHSENQLIVLKNTQPAGGPFQFLIKLLIYDSYVTLFFRSLE